MPFGLKNAPSEFQNVMNDIFTSYTKFIIVYIDDVLVFSKTLDQHFKHLQIFTYVMEHNNLTAAASIASILDKIINELSNQANIPFSIALQQKHEHWALQLDKASSLTDAFRIARTNAVTLDIYSINSMHTSNKIHAYLYFHFKEILVRSLCSARVQSFLRFFLLQINKEQFFKKIFKN